MTPDKLNWQNFYGSQVKQDGTARTEAAVIHAAIWPSDPKATQIDLTDITKRVYRTPGGAPGQMETVVQFNEAPDPEPFKTDKDHRPVFTVSVLELDHVSQLAVVCEFSYQPDTYLRVPTEIVGTPPMHQVQVDYQLANAIRELAAGTVKSNE